MADEYDQRRDLLFTRVIPVLGVTFLLFSAYVTYAQFKRISPTDTKENNGGVLGEKVQSEATVCTSSDVLATELERKGVVVPLLAPDKRSEFRIAEVASCMSFPTCETSQACSSVVVKVDTTCLAKHFETAPLDLTEDIEITGLEKTVFVRKQDWVVSYADFSKQLAATLEQEMSYCDLKGETATGSSKLTMLTVPVTDILPSAPKTFATKFLEIDNSKEKAYYWVNGAYQEFRMLRGADVGANRIEKRSAIDVTKYFTSRDSAYLAKQLNSTDFIIVHE